MKYHLIAEDDINIFDENNKFLFKLIKEKKNLFYNIFSLYNKDKDLLFRYKYPTIFCFMNIKILYQNIERKVIINQKMCKINLLYNSKIIKHKSFFSIFYKGDVFINDQKSASYRLRHKKTVPIFSINIDAKYRDSSIPILILFLLKISNFNRGIMYSSDF